MRYRNIKSFILTSAAISALAVPALAQAQDQPPPAPAPSSETETTGDEILVTGSRIKQDPTKSALPLQIITTQDLSREGITSPEQMLQFLSTSGTGPENLASNSDVVSGAQRGTNGLSAANLRGQGSAATLVLLNGRRVAAHGLSGGAVDVNQIPFAAIERVEVLKDGASAIYGTDAIGGVINFITKTNYQGIGFSGNADLTQRGDGNIYRIGAIAGYGDLQEDGFNVMGAVSYRWNQSLQGKDRDFTSGNQPDRGLSIDTRGTPYATIFNIGANTHQTPTGTLTQGLTLIAPNAANVAGGGINPLDLPGGPGCGTMLDGMNYDYELWQNPAAYYACSWDTGRNVVIQQPIKTLTYFGRAVGEFAGDHRLSFEVTGSKADSAKLFSHNQYSANATTLPIAYPLNANTATTYNTIFNQLKAAFPASSAALDARYGRPIAFRWRCVVCGQREYKTTSETFRAAIGLEGPLFGGWDYRAGASYSKSETSSLLGQGYHYRGVFTTNDPSTVINEIGMYDPRAPTAPGAAGPGIVGLFNSGIINPFSLTQSPEALAGLEAVSAEGTTLYGGRYEVRQLDYSISGPLFDLPGGSVKVALGIDYRKETYEFNGSPADAANQPNIFNAAFDNANALRPKSREVKAAYGEILIPVLDILEITAAARVDDYSGFGSTFNPKVAFKFRPIPWLMFRGSYNSGFRVPSFNQIFNGRTESPTNTGANIADPLTCATPTAPTATPGCALITPDVVTGGNPVLGPETAKQANLGVVFQPAPLFSLSVDWWMINVNDTIQLFSFRDLLNNYALFEDRFIRDPGTNAIIEIDSTWANAGARRTQGLEVSFRGGFEFNESSRVTFGLDGTYLLKKKEKLTQTSAYGPSLIGVFSFNGDLGLKWRHNAWVTYSSDDWTFSLSQIFRNGYKNQKLPGIASGAVSRPGFNERVSNYVIHNFSASYRGLAPNYTLTFGVRNLFDKDPPFAISYDSLGGSGGSWEPRVADPRGRSFTISFEVNY